MPTERSDEIGREVISRLLSAGYEDTKALSVFGKEVPRTVIFKGRPYEISIHGKRSPYTRLNNEKVTECHGRADIIDSVCNAILEQYKKHQALEAVQEQRKAILLGLVCLRAEIGQSLSCLDRLHIACDPSDEPYLYYASFLPGARFFRDRVRLPSSPTDCVRVVQMLLETEAQMRKLEQTAIQMAESIILAEKQNVS